MWEKCDIIVLYTLQVYENSLMFHISVSVQSLALFLRQCFACCCWSFSDIYFPTTLLNEIRQDNGSQVSSLAFLVTEWADTEIWANTAQPSGCKHHVTDTLSTELTRNLKQANGHGQNMSRGDRKWPVCDSGRTGWNACHENGELRSSHYVYNNHSDFSDFSCFFKTISILVC